MKEFETERLFLRKIKLEDAYTMNKEWCNDEEVCKYLPWNVHGDISNTIKLVNLWIKEYECANTYRWIVCLKETGECLGTIDIVHEDTTNKVYEVGYCYKKSSWGNGYGTEALRGVVKFLFDEVGAFVVCAKHYECNIGSYKVMEKAGMTVDGALRSRVIFENKRISEIIHSITKEEYLRNY